MLESELSEALLRLAEVRPVFYTESDFRHAFAWQLHLILPDTPIRFELPLHGLDVGSRLDLVVRWRGKTVAFEFKYCVKELLCSVVGEDYALPKSNSRWLARHDMCKDIWRLEHAIGTRQADVAYSLALSNDPLLWTDSEPADMAADFRIHEGRSLSGPLRWRGATYEQRRGREKPLDLYGDYLLRWREYSNLPTPNGEFRLLVVPVTKGPKNGW